MATSFREAFAEVGIAAPAPSPPPEPDHPDPAADFETRPLDPDLRRVLDQGLATGSVVALARHTVERYQERFERDCDFAEAKRRLYARLHRAAYSPERPAWLVHVPKVKDPRQRHNVGYLVIDDEIVLPIRDSKAPALPGRFPPQPLTAVTCLYRI